MLTIWLNSKSYHSKWSTRKPSSSLALSIITLVLAGCAAGPDYKKPEIKVEEGFYNAPGATAVAEEPIAEFWTAFNDPLLNQLVSAALKNNPEVKVAVANLQAARAQDRGVEAEFFPTIGVDYSVEKAVTGQTLKPGSRSDRTQTTHGLGVDMSWEANLFGRFFRAKQMSAALTSAEEAGIHAAQVSVTAEVASQYFQLRGLQAQIALSQETLKNLEALQSVVKTRFDLGRSGRLEVEQVSELLESTRANLPQLESSLERIRYRLARLTGQMPLALNQTLSKPQPLPGLPALQKIGTPASLLRRRPDVRQAERRLAAATANIGFNTADLFPTVNFTGRLGLNAGTLGLLTDSQAFLYNLGASIAWTALDFGRIRSRIEGSKAQANAALAVYEGTVLTALEETEGALVSYSRTAQQSEYLYKALQSAQEMNQISRIRFEAGAIDILTVLDAERRRITDQSQFTQSQTAMATTLVSIYKALGGGWKPV